MILQKATCMLSRFGLKFFLWVQVKKISPLLASTALLVGVVYHCMNTVVSTGAV